jgi:hypothetical protein
MIAIGIAALMAVGIVAFIGARLAQSPPRRIRLLNRLHRIPHGRKQ